MRLVYHRRYNIGFYGLERLHPFDSRKYGRAWRDLRGRFGKKLDSLWSKPGGQATSDELQLVHTAKHLSNLGDSAYVAQALELPPVARLPGWLVDRHVLQPMRWATAGTILAAGEALSHGLAVNLSGGYHHAKPDCGEGFCVYSDIGIAVARLRQQGRLSREARIAYIDLDAHQGNGVCHVFAEDSSVFIFDMFNSMIYPMGDEVARRRIDCCIPLYIGIDDASYLRQLRDRLPGFLDSVGGSRPIELAIYNAGTDVYRGDPLGSMDVSARAVLERDLFVVEQLRARNAPTVMVLSGGYTRESYLLVANSVEAIVRSQLADDGHAPS